MIEHYSAELAVTVSSQIHIKERINKHYRIEKPTKISNTIGKAGVHTEHPCPVGTDIKV